jgi:hypothetical protein
LTFSLQYEIMTRKTESFPGGGQRSAASGSAARLETFMVSKSGESQTEAA